MSSSRINDSSKAKTASKTAIDAKLHAKFEESGGSFEYLSSLRQTGALTGAHSTDQQPQSMKLTRDYFHSMHSSNLIQPFGCLLAVDGKAFKVVAYSENALEMLPMGPHVGPRASDRLALGIGIGTDVRTIFTDGAAELSKAFGYGGDISVLNPILVHCRASGKPFYAVVHKVTQAFIIDFEPVMPYDAPMTAATGPLQFYKHAAKTVAKLQSLHEGSMEKLCNTMVQEVFNLTGYDRVMAYRFHDDDHGEVIAEVTRPGLESYLGLHYPAADIPQTARFLFIKNMVRMIGDCRAKHVKVVQDEQLELLSLCGSTLRAPHSCHQQYMVNMNSVASLVLAVIAKEVDEEAERSASSQIPKKNKFWGLIVCHHTSPIYTHLPLRYACKFIAQVFGNHISKQLELERYILYKSILYTQTLLCDTLLQDAPLGIVSGRPSMLNLIKSDGTALLYGNRVYRMGVAPTGHEVNDIVAWLNTRFPDIAGFSTNSLCDAMFPGGFSFGDVVCGMAAVRITSTFVLLWFRSRTDEVLHWAGEKHEPGQMDDGKKMHPRSSFKAFKEAAKRRSLPWKDIEMKAIHSLQLTVRNIFYKDEEVLSVANAIHTKLRSLENEGMQEPKAVTAEIFQLIEAATVPVLAVDVQGLVQGWNTKLAELSGLPINEAIGKELLILVEESSVDVVRRMFGLALQGKAEQNVQFEIKTHASRKNHGPVSLLANACLIRDLRGTVVCVCLVTQDLTNEKIITNKFVRLDGGDALVVHNPRSFNPPIFGTNESGFCCEWNQAMVELSGWRKAEVIDKMLLGEVFGVQEAYCKFRNQEAFVNFGIMVNNAMSGQECQDIDFSFFSRSGVYVECFLSVSKKLHVEGIVSRIFYFLQPASPDLQNIIHVKRLAEQAAAKRMKTLAFVKRQVKIPLSGISFTRKILEGSDLGEEQKKILSTSVQCERQLNKVLNDTDIDLVIDGYPDLEMSEFTLHEVLNASMSQVIRRSNEKNIEIYSDFSDGLVSEKLYGDGLRLQQVLSDFLSASVNFTPDGGHIGVSASLTKHNFVQPVQRVLFEFRITLAGDGLPGELIMQMFGESAETSEEGMSLRTGRKILKLMNGHVKHIREMGKSMFVISAEFTVANTTRAMTISC